AHVEEPVGIGAAERDRPAAVDGRVHADGLLAAEGDGCGAAAEVDRAAARQRAAELRVVRAIRDGHARPGGRRGAGPGDERGPSEKERQDDAERPAARDRTHVAPPPPRPRRAAARAWAAPFSRSAEKASNLGPPSL